MISRGRSRGQTWRTLCGDLVVTLLAFAIDMVIWNGDRQLRGGGTVPIWVVPQGLGKVVNCPD